MSTSMVALDAIEGGGEGWGGGVAHSLLVSISGQPGGNMLFIRIKREDWSNIGLGGLPLLRLLLDHRGVLLPVLQLLLELTLEIVLPT